jgi:hypothetical protein
MSQPARFVRDTLTRLAVLGTLSRNATQCDAMRERGDQPKKAGG